MLLFMEIAVSKLEILKMVSEEALKEFKEIYKEEYGVDLDDRTATDLAVNLLTLFDKIYRPIKKSWWEEYVREEVRKVEELIYAQFKLDINGIHGIKHWKRVQLIGRYLAEQTKADVEIIDLFAFLHDSKREDDYDDIYHGKRASVFAQELYNRRVITIREDQLKQLQFACEHHTNSAIKSKDITIQTCWDADRLDLWRLGIKPDPHFLNTEFAKQEKTINLWKQC